MPRELDSNNFYYVKPKTLLQGFEEVQLEDALGGIAVWEAYEERVMLKMKSHLSLPLDKYRDISAFYSNGNKTTLDVPHYVIYVSDWFPNRYPIIGYDICFSKTSWAGVNYVVFNFFNYQGEFSGTVYNWEGVESWIRNNIKRRYPQMRLMLGFGDPSGPKREIISNENTLIETIKDLVSYAKFALYDGIDFYPGMQNWSFALFLI